MKIKNNKKIFFPLLSVFLGVGIFLLAQPVHASWAAEVVGGLLGLIIGGLGVILSLVMKALVMVAQYSEFIQAPAVKQGWVIVRDLCNMFFVLILLIIAFATILHQEKYDYKKWLPKLVLMAVMINFSKTICGLLIDFAQVIMLTFVNAFKGMAAGNLVDALGLTEIMTLAKDGASDIGFFEIVTAYLLGLIYVIVALVVIVTMLAMLVMRIVMMWVYIVLSPAAYLLAAFPDGKSYSEKWWKQFTENLIVGPVLAFFIWLSFASLQSPDFNQFSDKDGLSGDAGTTVAGSDMGVSAGAQTAPADTPFTASKASTPNAFIKFVIAIGMLVGGLKIAQEVGGAASDIAGKGFSKLKNGASAVGAATSKFAKDRGRKAAKWSGRQALGGASFVAQKAGQKIQKLDNGGRGSKLAKNFGGALAGAGGIGLAWRQDMVDTKNKGKVKKRQEFMEKIGMGDKAMGKTDEFLKSDVGKNASNALAGVSGGAALGTLLGPAGTIIGGAVGVALAGVIGVNKSKTSANANAEITLAETDEALAKDEMSQAELVTSSKAYKDGSDNKKANEDKSASLGDEINDISQDYDNEINDLTAKRDAARKAGDIAGASALSSEITNKNNEKTKAISKKVNEKSKIDAKIKDFEDMEKTVNDHRDNANNFNASAKTHRDAATQSLSDTKAFGISGKTWARMAAYTSETTQKAAANRSKESIAAKDKVKTLGKEKNAAGDFEGSAYYSASGQTGSQKKLFNELTNSANTDSKDAIANLTDWAKNVDPKNDKQMAKVEALAKGIAAFSKGGGDTSSLNSLISELDKKNSQNKKPIPSVSSLTGSVIANRKTGTAGEQGSGSFDVNTFANNTSGEDGKNLIGVDFNKLSGAGLDVKAEASFASGSAIAPIVEALKKQIEEEKASLMELKNSGGISEADFSKKNNDLDKANTRLSDPKQVQDLQLINTASANYGRQERMTSKYHEEIHKGGVEDEDLTERTAKSLMDNKLYGRNAKTKGRHASEVGAFAQNLKNQGMSNDDIMKEVDKEIQSRLQSEGKNRAERVVKIMNGDKETVTEAVSETKIEASEINTDKLQESLDVLSEKFEKTASSFKNISGGAGGDKKGTANMIFALKNIKKAITSSNSASLKKMSSLSGGKPPTTIIEASALNDAAGDSSDE